MAVTNLLPAGSDAATSSNFVLAGGQTMTLAGAARGTTYWRATIERRMSDGAWEPVGFLAWDFKMTTLYGDGEYRISRQQGHGCIVDGAKT
ncbi:MAG: hypothetical protein J0H59_03030 [Comamonadaceae bacterium]|nr:hypothetical protein [Comamonadaceae bacterium]